MENEKKAFTEEQKLTLLKVVLDDETFNLIKDNPKKIDEAFDFNLANIII
jgi:hypothetical protein